MRMRHTLLALPAAAVMLFAVPTAAFADESVQVKLDALNNSGASGTATLTATGNGDLKISIRSKGMVPNSPHAQHLHGAVNSMDFHCPPMSADKDGNGFVSTEEGLPSYGDIFISLTSKGDTTKASGLAVDRFPVADGEGNLSYERTIEVDDATVEGLKNLHIVQHGLDLNDNGEYDAEAGQSSLDPSLPLEATAPATCGMVEGSNIKDLPEGGVETGDGSTAGVESAGLIGLGGASLAAAAGGLVLMRRRAATAQR